MDELNMIISGIVNRDGKKKACVYITDGDRYAEGYIPDCKIETNSGFDDKEIAVLETYMRKNLETIKEKASGVSPIKAIMKD